MANTTREQTQEYAQCAADMWHFISTYVYILDPEKGVIKFEPWPHLKVLVDTILSNDRVVILKARQIGITWLISCISLWYCLFRVGANIQMYSKGEKESSDILAKTKFVFSRLPGWMQQPTGKYSDTSVTFPTMNSIVQSFPATEDAGRGGSATLVILDEWAFQKYARTNISSILPLVEHGKLIGISTANGKGNLFYETYDKALRGTNSFLPVFIPYTARPGRTHEWREKQKQDMPTYLALQEYPEQEKEAFIIAGTCMFKFDALSDMPIRPPATTLGYMEIYSHYDSTHSYIAGIDTALGIEGRDYSVMQVIDITSGEQVARIRTQIPIEQFAEVVADSVEYYKARVIIEEQPQGRVIHKTLIDRKYPTHLIYHRSKNVPCWATSVTNRARILFELETATRTGTLILHSQETVDEMLSFGYNEKDNKFEALSGHDDDVMALALANHLAHAEPPRMTDFTTKKYIPSFHLTGWRDINWKSSDPFKHVNVERCPECKGMRYSNKGPCEVCRGAGVCLSSR